METEGQKPRQIATELTEVLCPSCVKVYYDTTIVREPRLTERQGTAAKS